MLNLIANRYKIISPIGEGGMGMVFKAEDSLLQRTVAIKIMRKTISDKATVRFQTEAKATARLNHPNIVHILNFDITPDREPYMVMDFLEGETLTQFLERQEQLSVEICLQIFFQVSAALSHAHKRKILHRDLKPANIVILANEETLSSKLLDFGIAKLFEEDHALTAAGSILGSPLYMSPEQAAGQTVDERSDIYSMGCLMYECLSGRPPFQGSNALETLTMHKAEAPIPLSILTKERVPLWIDQIVLKCLNKQESDRYQSVDELVAALTQAYEASDMEDLEVAKVIALARPRLSLTKIAVILLVVSLPLLSLFFMKPTKHEPIVKVEPFPPSALSLPATQESSFNNFMDTGITIDGNKLRVAVTKDEDLALCANYPGPERIDLSRSVKLNGSGLKYLIARSPKVIVIKFRLRDENFKYLGKMKSLTELKLDGVSAFDGSGFRDLRGLSKLETLSLERCKVTNEALKNIAMIPNLRYLDLKRATGYDANGLSYLRPLRLELLDLSYGKLTDEVLKGISGMNIRSLHLVYNEKLTNNCCSTIKSVNGLKDLALKETGIRVRDRSVLAKSLGLGYDVRYQNAYPKPPIE